jgi:hypothetical protein
MLLYEVEVIMDKSEVRLHLLVHASATKFHANSSSGLGVETNRWMDG